MYQGFRGLGGAARTEFLLGHLHDSDLLPPFRFNGLTKWLVFGDEGMIATNDLTDQRKNMKYNHFVANSSSALTSSVGPEIEAWSVSLDSRFFHVRGVWWRTDFWRVSH